MEIFKTQPKIDFLGQRKFAYTLSLLLIVGAVYVWIERGAGKYGIDFRGGHEIVVQIGQQTSAAEIARALDAGGLKGAAVQSFEVGSDDYAIRLGWISGLDAKAVKERVQQALDQVFEKRAEIIKTDSVGAIISDEMKRRALWALGLGLIGILVYITVRFEFAYSLGAVVAMFHDVAVATGFYLLAGHDLNASALAAALTIVGYSVNDTIVVFDRVREQRRKNQKAELGDLMNDSMNACLSRTIITSLLTLFAALALLMLGGGAIQDLSLFLVVGLISGTYSTIYIAAPVVLAWENLRSKRAKK